MSYALPREMVEGLIEAYQRLKDVTADECDPDEWDDVQAFCSEIRELFPDL